MEWCCGLSLILSLVLGGLAILVCKLKARSDKNAEKHFWEYLEDLDRSD